MCTPGRVMQARPLLGEFWTLSTPSWLSLIISLMVITGFSEPQFIALEMGTGMLTKPEALLTLGQDSLPRPDGLLPTMARQLGTMVTGCWCVVRSACLITWSCMPGRAPMPRG